MTCATFILRLLKAHCLHTFRRTHLAQGASPKSIRLRSTPYTAPPFLRWTQHTATSGAMEQQSVHIACSNHYWSEHKALLLHTPTNSATQSEPILLRPSTTSATHHDTIQISHPPSRKDAPTSRARTLYMYHAMGDRKDKSSAQSLTGRAFQ